LGPKQERLKGQIKSPYGGSHPRSVFTKLHKKSGFRKRGFTFNFYEENKK